MVSKFLLNCAVIYCLVLFIFNESVLKAQEIAPPGRTALHTIYAEIFGSASGNALSGQTTNYSVNYDRVVNEVFALRLGISCTPVLPIDDQQINVAGSTFTIPITASYLHNFNGSSHNAEIGFGIATSLTWYRYDLTSQAAPAFASSYPNGKVTWTFEGVWIYTTSKWNNWLSLPASRWWIEYSCCF